MEKKELLSAIYENITQENSPTAEYLKLQEEFVKERELFLKRIGEDNRESLEKVTDVIYDMGKEMNCQSFIEGYSTAVRLFLEAVSND